MYEPYQAAPDVHVLSTGLVVPGVGTIVVNSFVLLADEPVLIDTGIGFEQDEFVDALATIVDPAAIKWVWLTHDDTDHTGCVGKILELAPGARLATHALGALRMTTWCALPLDRVRAIVPGDDLRVGDRTLTAVVPPVFDNPTSTGLLDRKTGYLFTVDAFGALVAEPVQHLSEIPDEALEGGMVAWGSFDAPWTQLVDRARFGLELDRIESLGCSRVFSSHLPPAEGSDLPRLRAIVESLPDADPFVPPGADAFAEIVRQMGAPATA